MGEKFLDFILGTGLVLAVIVLILAVAYVMGFIFWFRGIMIF